MAWCNAPPCKFTWATLLKLLADLQQAGDLFDGMDDTPGQIKLYLLWGYDYHGGLGDWRQARRRLVRVGQLLKAHPKDDGMVVQEGIRFWLSLGQVALNTGRWPQAENSIAASVNCCKTPAACLVAACRFLCLGAVTFGTYPLADDPRIGKRPFPPPIDYFQKAFQAVEDGGCPDEIPLILLHLGLTAHALGDARCWHYLETAVQAAQQRARFADRQAVLQQAGEAFTATAPNDHLKTARSTSNSTYHSNLHSK